MRFEFGQALAGLMREACLWSRAQPTACQTLGRGVVQQYRGSRCVKVQLLQSLRRQPVFM